MKVFISWSGPKSGAVAKALRDWLPMVVNAFDPFLSSDDIDKGTRWSTEIAQELEKAKAGIICLTSANLHSDWLLFEAGALSKKVAQSFVCPLLIDLKPSDVVGPLAQFQATTIEKPDVLQLLKTLNLAGKDPILPETHLEKAFDKWWLDLETVLKKLPSDGVAPTPQRPEREILEEILGIVRDQSRLTFRLGEGAEARLALRQRQPQEASSYISVVALQGELAKAAVRLKLKDPVKIDIIGGGPGYAKARIVFNGVEQRLNIPRGATASDIQRLVDTVLSNSMESKENP